MLRAALLHSAAVTAPDSQGLLEGVEARFADSTDFTVGLEEEYQILDRETRALTNRFEDVMGAVPEPIAERFAGELIASEIEYRTVKHDTFATAARELVEGRLAAIDVADRVGVDLGITGVHPFSRWEDQRLIDTPHYRLLDETLGYVAWTNNTWSTHLHCGIRDADRAIAIMTAMRGVLPELLAVSANSPIFMGRATRLHSTRTQVFVRSFPRCGIPDAFRDWREYADYIRFLETSNSIRKSTQIWWSIRPHHSFGTIEVRICDGQTDMRHAVAVMALAYAAIARFAAAYDDGEPLPAHADRVLEENLWRAIRYGQEGMMIDLDTARERPTRNALTALCDWVDPVVDGLGLRRFIDDARQLIEGDNGALWQLDLLAKLGSPAEVVEAVIERTRTSALAMRDELQKEMVI